MHHLVRYNPANVRFAPPVADIPVAPYPVQMRFKADQKERYGWVAAWLLGSFYYAAVRLEAFGTGSSGGVMRAAVLATVAGSCIYLLRTRRLVGFWKGLCKVLLMIGGALLVAMVIDTFLLPLFTLS